MAGRGGPFLSTVWSIDGGVLCAGPDAVSWKHHSRLCPPTPQGEGRHDSKD